MTCYCPVCPRSNWNPWNPSILSEEEACEIHNNLYHNGYHYARLLSMKYVRKIEE